MSILIVDDMAESRRALELFLRSSGYSSVLTASSARDAFAKLGMDSDPSMAEPVEAVLMDLAMPETDGIEACRRIRQNQWYHDLPILIVTGHSEAKYLEIAFAAGATDFIAKPVNTVELLARLRSAISLKHELEHRRLREQELLKANEQLERLSFFDGLTEVANRRYFDVILEREWNRAIRQVSPLALVLADIDRFKQLNDVYGHLCGDECLRQVARALETTVQRPADLVARYGGEEFAVLLPDTGLPGAFRLAERLRAAVQRLEIAADDSRHAATRITISLGVACTIPRLEQASAVLIEAADTGLYQAKRDGRNMVRVGMFKDQGAPARSAKARTAPQMQTSQSSSSSP
jgi:diguanylate cyclase (GGDEF)-like protein